MFETPQMYRWRDPSLPPNAPSISVHFLQTSEVNAEETAKTGVQTYDNVLVVVVAPMGMPKSDAHYEVERTLPDGTVKTNLFIANKYGEQLKLYKAGQSSESQGTPLKDLIGMTPATIMNLKSRGIHTVEMLADMADGAGQEFMGFWDIRDRARKHVEMREKNAPMVRVEAALAERDETIANLTAELASLRSAVEAQSKGRKAA